MNTPFCLVKLFDQKKYAEAFGRGELHAKKLRAFRECEERGRGDQAEGTTAKFVPSKGTQHILTAKWPDGRSETATLTADDGFEEMTVASDAVLDLNVFCMIGVPREDVVFEGNACHLSVPNECFHEFGQYAVVITNVDQFLARVQHAARREGYQSEDRSVTYYDPSTFLGHISDRDAAFRKPKKFEYQKEFRIAFDAPPPGPLTLNVGGLHDISTYGELSA